MRFSSFSREFLLLSVIPVLLFSVIAGSLPVTTSDSLVNLTILIDPGHGGVDSGANVPGALEKDINLAVALKVKDKLQGYGANVILTRETDIDLSSQCNNERVKGRHRRDLAARIEFVEEVGANIYVSIHTNANLNKERRGAQTFYWHTSEVGKALAGAIHTELLKTVISDTKANPGNYFILKRNEIPAALVEVGYLTNPEERLLLQSAEHQQKLAAAIAAGIYNYCLSTR